MLLATSFLSTILLFATTNSDAAIRAVLSEQAAAWNRGDLDAFVATYAQDCLFVGTPPVRGRDLVLKRYRSKYPDRARMGHLTFTNLETKKIDEHSATVLGNFHLDRDTQSGGSANGVFSLVLSERDGHWLIILDHTS